MRTLGLQHEKWQNSFSPSTLVECCTETCMLCWVHHALSGSTWCLVEIQLVVELWLERCFVCHGGRVG
jgi:hypothetical protein